jgi:hypothetical protein
MPPNGLEPSDTTHEALSPLPSPVRLLVETRAVCNTFLGSIYLVSGRLNLDPNLIKMEWYWEVVFECGIEEI